MENVVLHYGVYGVLSRLADPFWFQADARGLLDPRKIQCCLLHLRTCRIPFPAAGHRRLHICTASRTGSGQISMQVQRCNIAEVGHQVESWSEELKAVYIYFDNDQKGFAAANAETLKALLGMGRGSKGKSVRAAVRSRRRIAAG